MRPSAFNNNNNNNKIATFEIIEEKPKCIIFKRLFTL